MKPRHLQLSVRVLLLLVAAVALNVWLFRQGILWGLLGLNLTKHVAIAVLCQRLGVNKPGASKPAAERPAEAMDRAGMVAEGRER